MKNGKFYGLITLVILSLSFSYVGCPGGGGGGGGGDDHGTAPTISSIKLFKVVEGVPIETLIFDTGDLLNWSIIANDPDLDMNTLFISPYLSPDFDFPAEADIELILPSQLDATMDYFFVEPIGITEDLAGNWRLCFWIVDKAGNESNEFCVHIVINEGAAPAAAVPPASLSLGLAPEGEVMFNFLNNSIEGEAVEER